MSEDGATEDEMDAYVRAGCAALGIPLDPAWAPEVRRNLLVVLHMAETVAAVPPPDEAEPAPVFRA